MTIRAPGAYISGPTHHASTAAVAKRSEAASTVDAEHKQKITMKAEIFAALFCVV
jgi:hypothetical protein